VISGRKVTDPDRVKENHRHSRFQQCRASAIEWRGWDGQVRMGEVPSHTPMAPTRVREPFHRAGWVYEEKVDGWRMLAYKDGVRVRLVSRNGRDHTRRFADLAAAIRKLSARTVVLDGEVAIYDSSSGPASSGCASRSPTRRHAPAAHGVRPAVPRAPRPDRPASA
jgi:ATP dependent DNA ligase domain